MKKVSVILPCHNGARWISSAIESVFAQTWEHFELVIIDDGSTDNSKETILPYLRDGRVQYINQENRGFSAAINRGVVESGGCLISFIGQDDLWMPNKLELQIKYLNRHKDVDLVYSDFYSIDSKERTIRLMRAKAPVSSRQEVVKRLFLSNFIGFETVLVKRKCFDKVGLFDERMVVSSDYDMWLRIGGSFNTGYLGFPLVQKREHEFQLSRVRKESKFKDELLIITKATDRYSFLKRVERKKLFSLYYAWSTELLRKGNSKKARQKLLKAIKCQPWKLKATIAYIAPTLYAFTLGHYQGFAEVHRSLSWLED